MWACSRVGCAMCSSSDTSHLTAWPIPFLGERGGVHKWTLTFGGLPHPTSISTALWEQHSGVTHLPAKGEPCIPRRCPRRGGVGPCHGVALTGAQRLSPRNLPVAADHFRCQTGFVSLGGAPPSLLAGTGAKSGFKKTSLAVGGGEVTPRSPGDVPGLPYACLGASSRSIPGAGPADAMAQG